MSKIIRKTYPRDFSVGVLVIISALVFFLSGQLFRAQPDHEVFLSIYLAELLVSGAVLAMVLILWEEILFPVKARPAGDGLIFRNHRTKLRIQALLYLTIPVIVVFLYMNYRVSPFRFFTWAVVCMILPVVGKLRSGINNYNDFLKLTSEEIEYKNNEKEGVFLLRDIRKIRMVKDDTQTLQKLVLERIDSHPVTIDLDEMELEAFYDSIEEFINGNYQRLLT